MTSPKDNPNDTFWLARYAHNQLAPVIEALPGQTDKVYAYLYLTIAESPKNPGLDIWIHMDGGHVNGHVIDYATINVTKATVDMIAERLPSKWMEARDAVEVAA